MLKFNYPVTILCYDGDNSGDGDGGNAGDPAAKAGDGDGGNERMFSQTELNKILADDKRKHQEKYTQLETDYKDLLKNQNLTKEERDKLQSRLDDVQKSLRTKDQQAEYERKQAQEKYSTELETERKRADHWESLFKQETVARSLQDAAQAADAFNSTQIVGLLKPYTELKEVDGVLTPMVDFPDVSEKDGSEVRTLRTPMEAVKRMRELPKIYGNLFKSNVVSGVGAGQASTGDGDNIDYASLTPEEYRKHRAAIKARLGR